MQIQDVYKRQVVAGKKFGGLNEVESVRFDLRKSEISELERMDGMLDGMKILSTVTDAVVPSRFKTAAYYRKMAEHDLSLVPARFYSCLLYTSRCV